MLALIVAGLLLQGPEESLADAPEVVRSYFACAERQQANLVRYWEERVAQAEANIDELSRRRDFSSRAERAKATRNARRSLEAQQAGAKEARAAPLPVPSLSPDPSVGDVGHVAGDRFSVRQVVGESELLAVGVEGRVATTPVPVLLRGIDPAQFKKPTEYPNSTSVLWQVTGMHTYETALGATKTVLVYEPVDPALIEEWRPAYEASLVGSK